ncbi:hypothetical protein LIT25_27325 (plasmid) [Bacillus sp. F19]|nr:hypothetical protein LIT25_27325 [Bacillus sp. F19]
MSHIDFIHKNNNKHAILFIHGFTGNSNTWNYPNKEHQSFPNMLKKDIDIRENFDIVTVNYFTKFFSLEKSKIALNGLRRVFKLPSKISHKNVGINDLSSLLKSIVDFNCSNYEKIVIIAHSMGGLVSKSYILNELSDGSCKVQLFLSLAVPHNGVDWATMGNMLYKGNEQIIDLGASSSTLNEINNRWIKQQNGLPRIVYFYGQSDRVVSKESAIGYQVEKQDQVTSADDHFTICKPEDQDDLVYLGVRNKILASLKEWSIKKTPDKSTLKNEVKYDDEIFIIKMLISKIHDSLIRNAKDRFFDAEYMKKLLVAQNIELEKLNVLYDKIEQLYTNNFIKYSNGRITNSDELITTIYDEIISKDKDFLKSFTPIIGELEKMGMLHQLANDPNKEIWWKDSQSMDQIDKFKEGLHQ